MAALRVSARSFVRTTPAVNSVTSTSFGPTLLAGTSPTFALSRTLPRPVAARIQQRRKMASQSIPKIKVKNPIVELDGMWDILLSLLDMVKRSPSTNG